MFAELTSYEKAGGGLFRKGRIVTAEQRPLVPAQHVKLPPSAAELEPLLFVRFPSATTPDQKRDLMTAFKIRAVQVQAAIEWLCQFSRLYAPRARRAAY